MGVQIGVTHTCNSPSSFTAAVQQGAASRLVPDRASCVSCELYARFTMRTVTLLVVSTVAIASVCARSAEEWKSRVIYQVIRCAQQYHNAINLSAVAN